ncbi:MAG: hypothetical protein V3T64_10715 [Myxococcota bacterium]
MRSRHSFFDPIIACAELALCESCASTPEVDPVYRPTENILEVIAVLRAHIDDDTYRFEPARDFTGRNVYRSSLLRLENLEARHRDAIRGSQMDGVLAFAKARSLERLRAFDLAAENYRLAADISEDLRLEALRSADVCDALHEAAQMTRTIEPWGETDIGSETAFGAHLVELDPDSVLAEFEARVALLDGLTAITDGTHHYPIAHEEIERADVARASYFVGIRKTDVNGDVRAIGELQRVTNRHPASKKFNRHLLELADLYVELAVEYSSTYPPESLLFDPVRFQELVEGTSRLYEMVASRDGTPEKLEASRRLEAFLAFSIRIDRDRFTP